MYGLPLRPSTTELRAVNGTKIPILGEATVNIKLSGKKIQFTGLATENVDELLGLAWLREQNATWKFGSGEVLTGDRKYQLLDGEKSLHSCRRLSAMQDVVLPPRSQLDVMANIINNQRMTRIQPKMTSDVTDWMTETGIIQSGLPPKPSY